MSAPYYQRVPYRLLRLIQSEVNLRVGPRRLSVPTAPIESLAYLYWKPSWKTQLIQTLLRDERGEFLDVGANVGTTMLDFLAAGLPAIRYFGFEPNSHCVHFLENVIQRNRLAGCSLIPFALSDADGVATLHLLPGSATDSAATMMESLRPNRIFEAVEIKTRCFDDLRHSLDIHRICLIKIDVEGAELEVLRGMAKTIEDTKPFILCEVLHADMQVDEDQYRERIGTLQRLIQSLGYAIWYVSKTPTGAVSRLEQIAAFPFKRWTHETSEECDYLFVPMNADAKLESFGFRLGR